MLAEKFKIDVNVYAASDTANPHVVYLTENTSNPFAAPVNKGLTVGLLVR